MCDNCYIECYVSFIFCHNTPACKQSLSITQVLHIRSAGNGFVVSGDELGRCCDDLVVTAER